MLFHSYIFVFAFLPVCLIGYYGLLQWGKKGQNSQPARVWLLLSSLVFYAWLNPVYLILLTASLLFNYAIYCLIRRNAAGGQKAIFRGKLPLILGITGNLGLLFYFKYADFFLENMNSLLQLSIPLRNLALPLGISFFTFQQISFLVDSDRGEVEPCSVLDYSLYLTYFPKLVEGPITSQKLLLPQLKQIGKHPFDWERFYRSTMLFAFGMMKKVLIADVLGGAADYGYANIGSLASLDAILVMLSYTLQLYFDFSGYCDMALGISGMLGIDLPLNFDSPYKASNIIAFWKRWHITLSQFFMKYVYIPLGGNRRGRGRMYLNLLIIFFLSGLWHGAGWNFILWGMLHGVLYVITRFVMHGCDKRATQSETVQSGATGSHLQKLLHQVTHMLSILGTFLYVNIAWVFFRAASLQEAWELLTIMLSGRWQRVNYQLAACFNLDELWYAIKVFHLDKWQYGHYILMTVFLAAVLVIVFGMDNAGQFTKKMRPGIWTTILMGGAFAWCVLHFANVSTFLYVNF